MSNTPSTDLFGMSDDDFLKLSPGALPTQEETPASSASGENEGNQEDNAAAPASEETPDDAAANPDNPADGSGAEPAAEPAVPPVEGEGKPDADNPLAKPDGEEGAAPPSSGSKPEAKPDDAAKPAGDKPADAKPADGDKPAEGKEGQPAVEAAPATPEQHKALYESLIGKPIRANGRDLILKTPEEVLRMVQMGAGYGRKLQDLQPALKTLRMLEKNELLDESKLSFLIDINNKNPEAIKKLIKDSGIDPLDLNMADNANYTPSNHSVSDKEMAFKNGLEELQATPEGKATISEINTKWDAESKQVLWDSPELLGVIQSQRENGLYDQITAEIDRQKTLGHIPPTTPFIQAYKIAGDILVEQSQMAKPPAANPTPATEVAPPAAPKVLDVRPAQPKPSAQNGDKARAASPTQTTPRKAKEFINPLDMADDEFLKTFDQRL